MHQHPLFLCVAHGFKGQVLLEEAGKLGVRTLLLAQQKTQGQWTAGVADEMLYFPDFCDRRSWLKRSPTWLAVAVLKRSFPPG